MEQTSLDLRPVRSTPPQYFVVTLATTEPAGRHKMAAVERYGIAKRNASGGFTVIDDVHTSKFAQARCDALNEGRVKA